jgi:hypothetical protein
VARSLPFGRGKVLGGAAVLVLLFILVTHARGAGNPPEATRFVSPDGSGSACTRTAPCGSFAQAYRSARPGQVVDVAGGTYPPQTIPSDSSKTSTDDVVFQPAQGATVTIGCPDGGTGCIDIVGSHVTIRGMHVATMPPVNGFPWQGSVDTERGSTDVTLVNLDAGSLNAASSNLTVRGGDWGPSIDPHNMRIVDECVNCSFDGLFIHDFAVAQGGHFECITFDGGTNVVIRNSEFRSCSVFAIFAKPYGTINGALIENNVFWNPRQFAQSNEIKFTNDGGGSCANIVIRYNLIADDINDECGNVTVYGNIQLAPQRGCGSGWDYNLFVGVTPCGAHSVVVRDPKFADPSAGNFTLLPGSPAIARGAPTFPPRDKNGRRRPVGGHPDAGPFEAAAPPRPAGVPARVPSWAYVMERWLKTPRQSRGTRPKTAPKPLPKWFADWRHWRIQIENS